MDLMTKVRPKAFGRDSFYLCTCGYSEKIEKYYEVKICPKCNAKYTGPLEKSIHSFVEKNIRECEFNGKKTVIKVKTIKEDDNMKLIKESENVYEFKFDFLKSELELKLNGAIIQNNKTNIKKTFSNFSFEPIYRHEYEKLKHNMFNAYSNFFGKYTFLDVYNLIIEYPQLEILYNTYGSLEAFSGININEFKKASKPTEILELSKPVLKAYYEIISEDSLISSAFKRELKNIRSFENKHKNKPDYVCSILKSIHSLGLYSYIREYLELIELGFEYQKLHSYIEDEIFTYQGISKPSEGIGLLVDYVQMSIDMGVSYDKYPKSLKLYHDLTSKNYKLVSTQEEIELFKEIIKKDEYKNLEFSSELEDYVVVNPIEINEIINEGRHLSHCVASYIKKIIKGETQISFMRNKYSPDKSLITLEVRDGVLKQYKGFSNRYPNSREMEFINKWAKYKNISR